MRRPGLPEARRLRAVETPLSGGRGSGRLPQSVREGPAGRPTRWSIVPDGSAPDCRTPGTRKARRGPPLGRDSCRGPDDHGPQRRVARPGSPVRPGWGRRAGTGKIEGTAPAVRQEGGKNSCQTAPELERNLSSLGCRQANRNRPATKGDRSGAEQPHPPERRRRRSACHVSVLKGSAGAERSSFPHDPGNPLMRKWKATAFGRERRLLHYGSHLILHASVRPAALRSDLSRSRMVAIRAPRFLGGGLPGRRLSTS